MQQASSRNILQVQITLIRSLLESITLFGKECSITEDRRQVGKWKKLGYLNIFNQEIGWHDFINTFWIKQRVYMIYTDNRKN